ncbi:hypothetical protein FHT85_005216 [Rhizobium sp. BK312]|nr:hypothetical protein [Rhizobium sp. BK312]
MNARLFGHEYCIALGLLHGAGDAGVAKADLAGDIELVGLGLLRIQLAFDCQVLDIDRNRIADDRCPLQREIFGDNGDIAGGLCSSSRPESVLCSCLSGPTSAELNSAPLSRLTGGQQAPVNAYYMEAENMFLRPSEASKPVAEC